MILFLSGRPLPHFLLQLYGILGLIEEVLEVMGSCILPDVLDLETRTHPLKLNKVGTWPSTFSVPWSGLLEYLGNRRLLLSHPEADSRSRQGSYSVIESLRQPRPSFSRRTLKLSKKTAVVGWGWQSRAYSGLLIVLLVCHQAQADAEWIWGLLQPTFWG